MVSVSHAEIPVSYYIVNATNNLLATTINGVLTNIIFTTGNYNAQSFATMLLSLTNLFATVYLSLSTGKFIFTVSFFFFF